jgi:dipeptidyl aminopeptidase/acylaminoacyl peptidase
MRLFKVDINAPEKMNPLTEENPHFYLHGGQLHPNNRWLIYGANYDFVEKKELEETFVYRVDLKTNEHKVLAKPLKATFVTPILSKDGAKIIYQRSDLDPAGQQIWLVDIDGENDHEILNFGARKKVDASWMPDSKRIVFVCEADTYRKVGIYDTASGEAQWLIDDPKRNIEFAYAPDRSDKVVIGETDNAKTVCSVLDLATKKETPLIVAQGSLGPIDVAADGAWIGSYSSSTQPPEIVSFRAENLQDDLKKPDITHLWENTSIKQSQLVPAQEYAWCGSDGKRIHGWLYRANHTRGTIVLVHGGPTAHDEDSFDAQTQFFVSCGFNVFNPNYRGSTGYGLEFQDSIKEDGWGGREQEDIRTGIESLIQQGIAARGKVGITGTSYGGYSSWHAITHFTPEIVSASAPICGMTDLVVDYNTTRPDLRPYSEEMMGGPPDKVPQRYHERSPINFVQNIKGQLLIVQGGKDPNVTPENVRQVENALKLHKIRYERLIFPDEGHGIYRPENQRTLSLKLANFFENAFVAGAVEATR